ncbi:MAG: beta-lactamase family protein [Caldilineaceae bacterium]|nr:beta-lactamase family protein [Caldilineaceae bacterium]
MGKWTGFEGVLQEAVPACAPALVCRVEQAGVCLYEGAFGWLDPEKHSRPVQVDSPFDLASVTKLFTATAFLRLVDRGLAALDQPLAAVLPEFGGMRPIGGAEDPLAKTPLAGDPRRAGEWVDAGRVTFRHLLTHTSGLPAWRSVYAQCGPPPHLPLNENELDQRQGLALAALVSYPFVAQPGESYLYSDTGLLLLGFAVARLSGYGRLDRALGALVCQPLGLSARFCPVPDEWERIVPTEACAWRERRLVGEVHDENAAGLGGVAGHAGLFATAADVCRLGRLFLNGGEGLLSPGLVAQGIREQHASAEGIRRGLGWQLRSDPNPTCSTAFSGSSFGHTGFTGTSLWCDPARALCVALLTNRVYHGRDARRIIALRPRVHQAIAQLLG